MKQQNILDSEFKGNAAVLNWHYQSNIIIIINIIKIIINIIINIIKNIINF